MKYLNKNSYNYIHNKLWLKSVISDKDVKKELQKYKPQNEFEKNELNNVFKLFDDAKKCKDDYDCKYNVYTNLSIHYHILLSDESFLNFVKTHTK